MMKKTSNIGLKGIHRVILADISSPKARRAYKRLLSLQKEGGDVFQKALREFNRAFKTYEKVIENVTPTEGRTIIAKFLSGNVSTVAEGTVNYGAVGTGSSAPAIGDTQLGTETFRKSLSSKTYSANSFYGTAFYAAGEGTGTLEEHGLFINGTAVANSGDIISRLLLGGLVKGASATLTIETEIQINDA